MEEIRRDGLRKIFNHLSPKLSEPMFQSFPSIFCFARGELLFSSSFFHMPLLNCSVWGEMQSPPSNLRCFVPFWGFSLSPVPGHAETLQCKLEVLTQQTYLRPCSVQVYWLGKHTHSHSPPIVNVWPNGRSADRLHTEPALIRPVVNTESRP